MYQKSKLNSLDAEEGYTRIHELLQLPQNSVDWRAEFNDIAKVLEERREEYEKEGLNASLPWIAIEYRGLTFIVSPPIGQRDKFIRLGIDVIHPFNADHLKSFAFPLNEEGLPVVKSGRYICLTTSLPDLGGVFALWDYISRLGITRALKEGFITEGWKDRVLHKYLQTCPVNVVRGDVRYPRIGIIGRYQQKETGKVNTHLAELEMLLRARGIGEAELEGEITRDRGGRLWTTWFRGSECTCCEKTIRSPSVNYPYSQYKHVKSITHRRKAAEFLLKQLSQGRGLNDELAEDPR